MLIEGADYFVRVVDFPVCTCGGAVTPNEDGTFTVLLNARLSHSQQMRSIKHERSHIEHDDFYRPVPVEQAEKEASG